MIDEHIFKIFDTKKNLLTEVCCIQAHMGTIYQILDEGTTSLTIFFFN